MSKYQLDNKGKAAVTKYHEKNISEKTDKKQQVNALREKYLKKKQASK